MTAAKPRVKYASFGTIVHVDALRELAKRFYRGKRGPHPSWSVVKPYHPNESDGGGAWCCVRCGRFLNNIEAGTHGTKPGGHALAWWCTTHNELEQGPRDLDALDREHEEQGG